MHAETERIRRELIARLAAALELPEAAVDSSVPFAALGLSSRQAVTLTGELAEWLGRPVAPTAFWDHVDTDRLAEWLATGQAAAEASPGPAPRSVPVSEPVAIVGAACRFPGAGGVEEFWELLREGRSTAGTLDLAERTGTGGVVSGSFLDAIDGFDAGFFGISPREAAHMDPQQRLAMELAWEAVEDAGIVAAHLAGSDTGVYVGIASSDYGRLQLAQGLSDVHVATGSATSIAANRISYHFDLRGPSMALDTACSSSLVGVHLACASLGSGESSLAIVGGVNLILDGNVSASFERAGFLAPDARCKAFDHRADGHARGEGGAILVLEPLGHALARGARVYAVILGTAVNQDGRSNGITAPSGDAQRALLREAHRRAGVSPGRIGYVEAHGTGTPLGDPIEAAALASVLGTGRSPSERCAIGSVKTNIGHLEAAAGVAGLLKTALALERGEIPASAHFERPNPHIDFASSPLRVQSERGPWPKGSPVLAGVSSFGFGGTNAHVVLEEPPPRSAFEGAPGRSAQLLSLSAHTPTALRALAAAYRRTLTTGSLADVCHTAGARRTHHDHRLALVCASRDDACAQLEAWEGGELPPRASTGVRPSRGRQLAMIFSGQGARGGHAGRELLGTESAFRAALERCDAAVRRTADWSVVDIIGGRADDGGAQAVSQPVQVSLQLALAALWRAWGVVPDVVAGHSLGEIAAAAVSGRLTVEDAIEVALLRGKLMDQVRGHGRTAVIAGAPGAVAELLAPLEGRVEIAAWNGPESTVVSGDADAVDEFVGRLSRDGAHCRVLPGDVAFHSRHLDPLRERLAAGLAELHAGQARCRMLSTVTGEDVGDAPLDGAYWARNLREPVRFRAALERLAGDEDIAVLEVGPAPLLASAASAVLRRPVLPSLRRGEPERATLLSSLGGVYVAGGAPCWSAVSAPDARHTALPAYPWQRQRHWVGLPAQTQAQTRAPAHPLLERSVEAGDGIRRWESRPTAGSITYLEHSRFLGEPFLPAAAYVDAALAAVRSDGIADARLTSLALPHALLSPAGAPRAVEVSLSARRTGVKVVVRSRPADAAEPWTSHAVARLQRCDARRSPITDVDAVASRCPLVLSAESQYAALAAVGLEYGPALRAVQSVLLGDREALAALHRPAAAGELAPGTVVDPVLLDGALQTVGALIARSGTPALHLPVRLRGVRAFAAAGPPVWAHARLRPPPAGGDIAAAIDLLDAEGRVALRVRDALLRRAGDVVGPDDDGDDGALRSRLAALEAVERLDALTDHVRAEAARVLRLSADAVGPDDALSRLGLDSMMAVELRGRLARRLDVVIAVAEFLKDRTPRQLAAHAAQLLEETVPATPAPTPIADPREASVLLSHVEAMSDAEVESMLTRLLEQEAMES